jgi:hypothetical protein
VGITVMWLNTDLAAVGGSPRIRAARRPTTVVVIRVCASDMSELALMWFENRVEAAAVALTLIVAWDW